MSGEAVAWACDQLPPKGRSKELLRLLAAYADAEGVAWAAIGTLGEEMQMGDRQVQRLLRLLEAEGFLRATGRFHHRTVPFYQLALDRPGALSAIRAARRAAMVAHQDPAKGDTDDTLERAKGDMHDTLETAKGDIGDGEGCHRRHPILKETHSNSDEFETGAREVDLIDPDQTGFEALFGAWRDRAPGRVSRKTAWPAFQAAAARVDPGRIAAAALRYLGEGDPAKGLDPFDLTRWLTDDRWEGWLGGGAGGGRAMRRAWSGPSEIRAAVVEGKGEAFAASWLDPARWDDAELTILTRTGLAADRLNEALGVKARALLAVSEIRKGETVDA